MTVKPQPREQRIELRVSATEKRAWERAARKSGLQLSQWIRVRLNEVALTTPSREGEVK